MQAKFVMLISICFCGTQETHCVINEYSDLSPVVESHNHIHEWAQALMHGGAKEDFGFG